MLREIGVKSAIACLALQAALQFTPVVRLPAQSAVMPTAQSAVMTQFLTSAAPATLDDLTRSFPYESYLRDVPFTDFTTMQADRFLLWFRYGDGDEFLYFLGDAFTRLYPLSMATLGARIDIGEAYLNAQGPAITPASREPYQIVGYFLLNGAARLIETEYRKKRFNPGAPGNAALVQRLARNRVHLAFEASLAQKVARHIRQRDFGYLTSRAHQFMRLVSNRVGRWLHPNRPPGGPATVAGYSRVSLTPYGAYLRRDSANDYEIMRMTESGRELGHVLFLRRPVVHAQYVATDVMAKFRQARGSGRLLAAFTGGFTNNFSEPEGFAVERGRIVNAILMPDRHGLVLIERNGSVRTLNLNRSVLKLPITPTTTLDIIDPLTNLVSYAKLVRWCKAQRATLFQTQLLAFSDSLLIDVNRSSGRTAERRLLALTTERTTGAVVHAVFNLSSDQTLYEAAEKAFTVLHARGLRVEGLLNLDTGSQDVFFVYDDRGNNVTDPRGHPLRGRRTSRETTSLLMYSY